MRHVSITSHNPLTMNLLRCCYTTVHDESSHALGHSISILLLYTLVVHVLWFHSLWNAGVPNNNTKYWTIQLVQQWAVCTNYSIQSLHSKEKPQQLANQPLPWMVLLPFRFFTHISQCLLLSIYLCVCVCVVSLAIRYFKSSTSLFRNITRSVLGSANDSVLA